MSQKKGKRLSSMERELQDLKRQAQKLKTELERVEKSLIEMKILQNQQLLEIVRRPCRVTLRVRAREWSSKRRGEWLSEGKT